MTADINIHKFFSALLGLYAYTGCDTVSAFAGKGKLKAMKLLVAVTEYIDLLCKVGKSMKLDEEMFSRGVYLSLVCYIMQGYKPPALQNVLLKERKV